MKFNPKDCVEKMVLTEGDGKFEIISGIESIAKSSGNEQIVLEMILTDQNECKTNFTEYLPKDKKMIWKIKTVLKAIGYEAVFNTGDVDVFMFLNKCGDCKIATKNTPYGDKSVISEYVPLENQYALSEIKNMSSLSSAIDDEIPF